MTRIHLIAITVAFCIDQFISSSKCPNDVVSKFQTELNAAVSGSVNVDIQDPDFSLSIKLRHVPDKTDIENALQCSSDDVYTGIQLKDFELDLVLKAKCGEVLKTKQTMRRALSHLEFTGGKTADSFKLSGIQNDIDFFAECKLTIFTSKESKNKKNAAIRKAIEKRIQEKLVTAAKRSILDWGVCTKQTLQKYRGIFEAIANQWTDIIHLDTFKAYAANYVKSFRVKLEFAPTLETMAASMFCDKAKNEFSELRIASSVNMTVLIEADPVEGSQKCKKKFEAKTNPLSVEVTRSSSNLIYARLSGDVSLIAVSQQEDCPLPHRGQYFWREGMENELTNRITELTTPCPADATSKLSAELDKIFREGFQFANANGLATFSSDMKSATAIKMKCNHRGELLGASSLADLPVSLKLQLSTENCPGGESKQQTSSMQLPLRLSVGTTIQNIEVYNPKNSRIVVSSCASLEDQVKGFLLHDAFAYRIRDAVIDAVHATWKPCPPQIIEKLLAAFSGSKEAKTTAKPKREVWSERLRKKRASSTQVKKFAGLTKEDYIIGCDVEKMPAKLTRFLTKDESKTITATLTGEVSTTCMEPRQRPCHEAPINGPCTGGCTNAVKDYGMTCLNTMNGHSCDYHSEDCHCKCTTLAGECHNDQYVSDVQQNGCEPRDENNPAAATMALPTKVKQTRAFSGTAALQFDFSKPGRRVDSSISYSLQKVEGELSGDCDPGIHSLAKEDMRAAVESELVKIFAEFT